MQYLKTSDELDALYGAPSENAMRKVAHQLTPIYRKWIMASRFCVLSTVGADGADTSPRGDRDPVVRELDPSTLAMPDWRGNNRLDTLRNIIEDGRISLMFMVPGEGTVVRVIGQARITADSDLCQSFQINGKHPRTVVVIKIQEIYAHCSRAIMRSELWQEGERPKDLPTLGQILNEMTEGVVDAEGFDTEWKTRGPGFMW